MPANAGLLHYYFCAAIAFSFRTKSMTILERTSERFAYLDDEGVLFVVTSDEARYIYLAAGSEPIEVKSKQASE